MLEQDRLDALDLRRAPSKERQRPNELQADLPFVTRGERTDEDAFVRRDLLRLTSADARLVRGVSVCPVFRQLRRAPLRPPATTRLPFTGLRAEFAVRIRCQKRPRVKPVPCAHTRENRRKRPLELRVFRTAMVPQCFHRRRLAETEHLLHTTIAVGGDDEQPPGERWRWSRKLEHEIVMKLALRRVIEQSVVSAYAVQRGEKIAEIQMRRKTLDAFHGYYYASGSVLFLHAAREVSASARHHVTAACRASVESGRLLPGRVVNPSARSAAAAGGPRTTHAVDQLLRGLQAEGDGIWPEAVRSRSS